MNIVNNDHLMSGSHLRTIELHQPSPSSSCLDNVAKGVLEHEDIVSADAQYQVDHQDVQEFKVKNSEYSCSNPQEQNMQTFSCGRYENVRSFARRDSEAMRFPGLNLRMFSSREIPSNFLQSRVPDRRARLLALS